ncbi:MAG TPA: helix-turn-helix domain-containing protein [Thermoleophilia bacterium]|nr:helix-turn-helix domain-containing protein [Thermoleophilia bacterium]
MAQSEQPRRTKREATTAAMLDAARELFAERSFAAVSVRDIAERAGVSHALVHRYLGSKDDVYRAVLARNETDIRDAAHGTLDLDEALSFMLKESQFQHVDYLRLVIASALQGMPYATTKGSFPAMQRLIELAEGLAANEPHDPRLPPARVAICMVVALDLGWAAMEKWLVEAASLEEYDREALVGWLEQAVLCIAHGMLPGRED